MTIKPIVKWFTALLMCGMMFNANAASISFDMDTYSGAPGVQVAVTINFDFTDNPSFGGGFNVIYDSSVLQFVSYTQAVFSGSGAPQAVASPIGSLQSPGNYLAAGVGSFDFFTGINTAGGVGTFVFNVLGAGGDGGCGATLCLTPDGSNPMVNIFTTDITNSVFANGITVANVLDLTDTDEDGDPDFTDPDDDGDGIGDNLDDHPLIKSNLCSGENAVLVNETIIDSQQCAAPVSVTIEGTTSVTVTGNLEVISPLISIQPVFGVSGQLTAIPADPCPACPPL